MSGCACEIEIKDKAQRRVLVLLFAINGTMFLVEMLAGIDADSTALIADSLDMLADASVYAVSLYAVGKMMSAKVSAAHISGILQVLLGLSVLLDVLRRVVIGNEPEPMMMLAVGMAAFIANSICLMLIYQHREGEVHMRASWIFSKNDLISNLGVITSSLLVFYTGWSSPDLIIGLIIASIVVRGGLEIIKDAKGEKKQNEMVL